MEKNLHVVVVTFNGLRWLPKCLDSLKRCSTNAKVIIVDNRSTDGSQDYIKNNWGHYKLIELQENIGFGKANNIGLRAALNDKTDGVFLLNQDAYIEPDTLAGLVQLANANEAFGIISPLHFNGKGDSLDIGFKNYFNRSRQICADVGCRSVIVYDVRFVNAAAWYLPRKTLDLVGGFDPIFDHYGEDADYCNRVLYHKLKIIIHPSVRVCHDRLQLTKTEAKMQLPKYTYGLYVNYLALSKKPDDGIWISFSKVLLLGMSNFFFEMLQHNPRLAITHLQQAFRVFSIFNIVSTNKRLLKKGGPVFLK